ncbi:MAG: SUMF1/EgtB/PvdO family nonheme iron enzyme [Kiritimatiellae bacterium]|nr:SUMF1/EgtB/PvdO family nonheme iron enzyme [Kiritimatiellia bacterium]
MKKIAATTIGVAAFALHLCAAPVVEITSVQQQYPWTNTVDITYTSTGVADANTYYVVFKAHDADGKEIGVITNDLKISQGSSWVAQWQPPFNVRYENCTMTPYVYKGGQDDYMIVDLETWQVAYEGMSTQAASNEKYNTPDYKTKKLVLRKISAGVYTNGWNQTKNSYMGSNSPHEVKIPKPYYMGIFKLTEGQYKRIMSDSTADTALPKVSVSNTGLRGGAGAGSAPQSGFFFELGKKLAAKGFDIGEGFDLPTEEMWEIAARAGVRTCHLWGDTWNDNWSKYIQSSTHVAVGGKLPNNWGLYDVMGNVWDRCRDVGREVSTDLANYAEQCANGLKPRTTGKSGYEVLKGGSSEAANSSRVDAWLSAGYVNQANNSSPSHEGFRIAFIP